MNSIVEFQRKEYEELLDILGLRDENHSEQDSKDDYFNAWIFGLRKEDCDFTITASL